MKVLEDARWWLGGRGTECRRVEVRLYRSGVCGRLTRVMAASVLGVEEVAARMGWWSKGSEGRG